MVNGGRGSSIGEVRPASDDADVLLLSLRGLADLVAYCALYEFEDVVAAVTRAERIDADEPAALEFSRRAFKLIRHTTGSHRLARRLAPRPALHPLRRNYELFLPMFNHPHELYALRGVPDWRRHCRVAACYINEVWDHQLPKYLLELLGQFDHVFIGMRHSVDTVARIVGRPCSYLPLAADVMRFAPRPAQPERTIDVCNIGRRSPVTHAALLKLAEQRSIFYYYDTFAGGTGAYRDQRTFHVESHTEHRLLLAQLLQRTRYYVANRSRINQPAYTGSRQEISARFFEGAAAGTVMIGVAPDLPDFSNLFDWPEAVIPVPFDCPEIGGLLAELDADPQRLERIRRRNLAQAARRHDWVHRLQEIYAVLGLSPTAAMSERQRALNLLVDREATASLHPARSAAAT